MKLGIRPGHEVAVLGAPGGFADSLAAQAGVRHSLENPFAYERANVAGHLSVLEACPHTPSVKHLVYASSSSVYGERPVERGFREADEVDAPLSLYAATKRSCELLSAQLWTCGGSCGLPRSPLWAICPSGE